MTVAGSLQLRLYRIARRAGLPVDEAADRAGIGAREARFTDADDRRDPPTPDCFTIPAGMGRSALGALADTPLGTATIARWSATASTTGGN